MEEQDLLKKNIPPLPAKRVIYLEPRKVNIPDEKKVEIIEKMAKAFEGRKKTKDPLAYARKIFERCIEGLGVDGKMWRNAPGRLNEDDMTVLKKRLRIFGYDYDQNVIIENIERKIGRKRKYRPADVLVSDENKEDVPGTFKYGSSIDKILTMDEFREYRRFVNTTIKDYPHFNNTTDKSQVEMLGLLEIKRKRIQAEMFISDKIKIGTDLQIINDQIINIQKTLGITAEQRDKKKQVESDATIDALSENYKETRKEFPELEAEYIKEELTLLLRSAKENRISESMLKFMTSKLYADYNAPELEKLLEANGLRTVEQKGEN